MNELNWLQEWYSKQCDGEWEHIYGVEIETLDNPGWHIKIDLKDIKKEYDRTNKISIDYDDGEWISCTISPEKFEGSASCKKLEEVISTFRSWVE